MHHEWWHIKHHEWWHIKLSYIDGLGWHKPILKTYSNHCCEMRITRNFTCKLHFIWHHFSLDSFLFPGLIPELSASPLIYLPTEASPDSILTNSLPFGLHILSVCLLSETLYCSMSSGLWLLLLCLQRLPLRSLAVSSGSEINSNAITKADLLS